jgi:hypothetical protein
MTSEQSSGIRKRLIPEIADSNTNGVTASAVAREPARAALNLATCATIHYSSEDSRYPIEHLIDESSGIGASRWASARWDATEQIILEFDEPQHISRIVFEVEEAQLERTQEIVAEYSADRGETYRQTFVQEYTFSPGGSTYQRESLNVELCGVTLLRLTIVPNKGGSGKATITSLRLFP